MFKWIYNRILDLSVVLEIFATRRLQMPSVYWLVAEQRAELSFAQLNAALLSAKVTKQQELIESWGLKDAPPPVKAN